MPVNCSGWMTRGDKTVDSITNERVKAYMSDPTLYRTVATVGDHVGQTRSFTCYSWAEGDEIQSAEDVSLDYLHRTWNIAPDEWDEVSTDTYNEVWR